MKDTSSSIIRPSWKQKKILRCKDCGKIFLETKILFSPKCHHCGSRKIETDKKVQY
jgi:predicted Zn-ribbon and HTH transcriptional regulator